MTLHYIPLFLICLLLTGCEKIATLTTPDKKPVSSHTRLSMTAENRFWTTLHEGRYDQLPETTRLMTAAVLENPNDPTLSAHLGFLHIWKITERQREQSIAKDPRVVNEIILARKYFADAVQLNPHDARTQGFLGDSILVEGDIFKDPREEVHGYFQLKHAIVMWPAFNYFTAGYPISTRPPHSDQFKEAMEWQWKTLDLCAGQKMNREHPDFSPYLARETQTGPLRACWNSWIAPHNFEGFFLNMGDMLVKQGDTAKAIVIYNNAKLSKNYLQWPYRKMLEAHIQNAKQNVRRFQENNDLADMKQKIMFNSGYGCVVCHEGKIKAADAHF